MHDMSCALHLSAVIATWDDGEVKILVRDQVGPLQFPMKNIKDAKHKPEAYLDKLLITMTTNQERIYYTHLPVMTEGDQEVGLQAYAPYLVLCPQDVIRAKGYSLVSMSSARSLTAGISPLFEMLEAAEASLINLVGTSTACLHMLPTFFTTVDIHRVHNTVLGGEVNRMTLRKRFVDTEIIQSTDVKVTVKAGRQPKEMFATINKLHIFGAMLSASPY
jgi:hypothetical protein